MPQQKLTSPLGQNLPERVRRKHDCSTPESRPIAALQRVDVVGHEWT